MGYQGREWRKKKVEKIDIKKVEVTGNIVEEKEHTT